MHHRNFWEFLHAWNICYSHSHWLYSHSHHEPYGYSHSHGIPMGMGFPWGFPLPCTPLIWTFRLPQLRNPAYASDRCWLWPQKQQKEQWRRLLTLPDLSRSLTCSCVTPFCRISYRASSSQSTHASSTVSSSSTSVNWESTATARSRTPESGSRQGHGPQRYSWKKICIAP